MKAHFLGQKTIPKKRTNQIIVAKANNSMGVKHPLKCLRFYLVWKENKSRKGPCFQQSKATFSQIQA